MMLLAALILLLASRERTLRALRASQKRHKLFFENSPYGIIHYDSRGIIEDINGPVLYTFGLSRERLLGHRIDEILGNRYAKEIQESLSGSVGYAEGKIIASNVGYTSIIKAIWLPFIHETEVISGVGIIEDITKRKQAEKELKYRAEFERLISQISSKFIGLRSKELDIGIERALASIGAFAGVDRAYVFLFHKNDGLADNTHEWCAGDIEPQIDDLKDISIEKELPWFANYMYKRKVFAVPDVKALPAEARAEREHFEMQGIQSLIVVPMVLEDRLVGFLGFDAVSEKKKWSRDDQAILRLVGEVFTNAIDRKSTEEALKVSEKRWQFALEGSGDGVWDWNAVTNRVYFSSKWKQMLGYSDNEIADKLDEWDSRVHLDDKPSVYEDLEAHLNGKTDIYQNEHRLLCKDGTYKWILDRGKVIEWTEAGKPLRVIGTHSDISDRKKWEIEREKLIAELKDALDRIKTLGGLLPICSFCKKIRNDEGYWDKLESYIQKHSEAEFSHGVCPECLKKHYPNFDIHK